MWDRLRQIKQRIRQKSCKKANCLNEAQTICQMNFPLDISSSFRIISEPPFPASQFPCRFSLYRSPLLTLNAAILYAPFSSSAIFSASHPHLHSIRFSSFFYPAYIRRMTPRDTGLCTMISLVISIFTCLSSG